MQSNRILYISLLLLLSLPAYPMGNKAQNHISQKILRLKIVQKILKEKNFEVSPIFVMVPGATVVLDISKEPSTITTAAQIAGIVATGGVGIALTTTLPFVGAAAAGGAVLGGFWWLFGSSMADEIMISAMESKNNKESFFGPGLPMVYTDPTFSSNRSDIMIDPVTQFTVHPGTDRYTELVNAQKQEVFGFQNISTETQLNKNVHADVLFPVPNGKDPKNNNYENQEFEIEEHIMDTINEAIIDTLPESVKPKNTTQKSIKSKGKWQPNGAYTSDDNSFWAHESRNHPTKDADEMSHRERMMVVKMSKQVNDGTFMPFIKWDAFSSSSAKKE